MLTIHYKTTGKNSFIYRVKGTAKALEQYREDKKAEGALVEEDNGTPLFFLSLKSVFQPSGTPIVRKEGDDGDVRYWPDDTEESIILRQALERAVLQMFGMSGSKQVETEREPDLDQKPEKPAKSRRGIK